MAMLWFAAGGLVPSAQAMDIAPFVAYRFGGNVNVNDSGTTSGTTTETESRLELGDTSSYGLILDFDLDPQRQIEVYLSRQNTQLTASQPYLGYSQFDLTVDYYHIGGLYYPEFPEGGGRFRPFVSGTFGLTRMDPKGAGLSTEDFFSLALGGGATYFPLKHLGLRFDARVIYTAVNTDSAIFCSGGCVVSVSSEGFVQTEFGASVVFRF
jgi:Outer membrane protein beta-barrel domain